METISAATTFWHKASSISYDSKSRAPVNKHIFMKVLFFMTSWMLETNKWGERDPLIEPQPLSSNLWLASQFRIAVLNIVRSSLLFFLPSSKYFSTCCLTLFVHWTKYLQLSALFFVKFAIEIDFRKPPRCFFQMKTSSFSLALRSSCWILDPYLFSQFPRKFLFIVSNSWYQEQLIAIWTIPI